MHSRARIAVCAALCVLAAGVGVPAAAASTATVKVSALTRSGQPAVVDAALVNLTTGAAYRVDSSGASVPTGSYAVGAFINEYPTFTVGVRTMRVGKSTTVTFDARRGVRVDARVDDPGVQPTALAVVPYAQLPGGRRMQVLNDNGVTFPARSTYVIPSPSSTRIRLAVHAALTGGAARYDLVRSFSGVPADLTLRDKRAAMARVQLRVSTIDTDQTTFLRLIPRTPDGKPVISADVGAPVLGTQTNYRTAGYRWGATLSMSGIAAGFASLTEKQTKDVYAGGHTYAESWGAGVWGPRPGSPAVYTTGGQLRVLGGPPICAWSGAGVALSDCQLQPQEVTYTVSRGGKQLGSGASVTVGVGAPAWYDVAMRATRRVGDLATAISARWHIRAGGRDRVETGYLHLMPSGLDERNRARPSSRTAVAIEVIGLGAVRVVTLAYSTDGTTWHAVKLVRKGKRWVGSISNPANGTVSLRTGATAASGAAISETVTDAYGTG